MVRCRRAAPVLSADGTWPQASSSCGSGTENAGEESSETADVGYF